MPFRYLLIFALLCAPSEVLTQSLSVEDLKAQIDAEISKVNPYAELLNDPDPRRAQAAMKIMLETGDPVLVNLALEFGLYSPDQSVRLQALRGHLNTFPRMDMFIDGSKADPTVFAEAARKRFSSSVNSSGVATWTPQILSYSEENNCYARSNNGKVCFLQIRNETIRMTLGGTSDLWYQLTLTDEGTLEGVIDVESATGVMVKIPIL